MEDELMVLIPMHLIERIRAEVRLQCGDWDGLNRCIEAASDPKVLACDVRLPPATTFPAGTKASTLLMAIQMRTDRPELERKFS